MNPFTQEVQLDNLWRFEMSPGLEIEPGRPYNVEVEIARKNGDQWDQVIRGQVKYTGCADFGFSERVMIHFCGSKDPDIFNIVYKKAMELMEVST